MTSLIASTPDSFAPSGCSDGRKREIFKETRPNTQRRFCPPFEIEKLNPVSAGKLAHSSGLVLSLNAQRPSPKAQTAIGSACGSNHSPEPKQTFINAYLRILSLTMPNFINWNARAA